MKNKHLVIVFLALLSFEKEARIVLQADYYLTDGSSGIFEGQIHRYTAEGTTACCFPKGS